VIASKTDVELVVADHCGAATRWYLSREAAAFVANTASHPHPH
jgi:hypothetical protein